MALEIYFRPAAEADLVGLYDYIAEAAGKLLGIKQPDLSKILRGQYRGYSVLRLMRMLTAFNQDVEITTRPHRKAGEAGRIIFNPL